MALGMRGFWTTDTGALVVEFERPSRWVRFVRWFDGWFWTDYKNGGGGG